MTQHTPGPWTVNLGSDRRAWGYVRRESDMPGVVAVAQILRRSILDEATANARLIAAAPELLIALQLALEYLEHPDVLSIPFAFSASAAAERIRAVIQKATEEVK